MQIGHHVILKQTGQAGRIHSFGNTMPTTINVTWISTDKTTSHEPVELDLSLCNHEHSMYKGLFCGFTKLHKGWCGCY
jgi:hypothetical protein